MSKKHQFNESLTKISRYLTEDKDKGDYVLICFFKQETYDIQDMEYTEGNIALSERYETIIETRDSQIQIIKRELSNFKNEAFKSKVAEFLQWLTLQCDFPSSYANHFSKDLKMYLSSLHRYHKDMIKMTQDVNNEFKNISPKSDLPIN